MADLSSKSYAKVVDLISEGEIQGLKDGNKSIYLNNTPLQNADNTYNFQGVTVETRTGTQNQSYIALAGTDNTEISNVVSVGVTVQQATPIVRTISNSYINAARVTLNFPQLRTFNNDGSTGGASVDIKIAVQYSGGSYTDVITDTVSGRASDSYQKNYLINLTGAFPVNIRVTRVTADSSDPKVANAFAWNSYTEITYAKTRYPNSALAALRFDAEQFSSFPERAYLIRGIKVRIPSNATVDTVTYPGRITYVGTWDGLFKSVREWTNDPCWCLFELLTNSRFGFGNYVDATQLDKWSFYAASQYCNELTSNGFGGYEPRFSCNVNIQQNADAYRLINDMASVFRAMPYWSVGSLTVSPDKPATSSYLFTLANVTEEGFSYSGSSEKTRSTVAVVKYFDMNLRDFAYEQVEDQTAIAKYGVQTKQIEAFACTSRGQANRLGRWLLYSEQYESEVVAFTTSIAEGVIVRPGMVIDVADPVRSGTRVGGRITTATTLAVTVDDATGLTMAGAPTLSVVLPTGLVETRNVASISGKVLTVSAAFSVAPNANSVWIIETNTLQTTQWRVISVVEKDDCQYTINALSYNASKYTAIEQNLALQTRNVTTLNSLPATPTGLTIAESLYEYQNQVKAQISVSWQPVTTVGQYQLRWRKDYSNWTTVDCYGPTFELMDITPGFFEFQVYSVNAINQLSTSALSGSITALGKTAPPSGVSALTYTVDPNIGVTLNWAAISDIDLDFYEIRRGTVWGSATYVTQIKATSLKIGYLDDGTYTYLVKAVDTSGIYSTNAASVAVTISGAAATTITSSVQSTDLVLTWVKPAVTTYQIDYYRVTYGGTYATSTELAKTQSTTFTVPINWTGSRTFWVAPVDKVGKFTDPPASSIVTISQAAAPTVSGSASGSTAVLSWNAVAGTLPTDSYEVRQGATFATATVIANVTALTYTLKATWSGSQTFWVVAKDANGNYGSGGSVVVTIATAAAPTLTSTFSGQNVVFGWTAIKGTLDTDYYLLKRGASWAAGTAVATIYSTAYTLKVDWGGIATFWLAAVDVNGNEGTPVSLNVTVTVPTAPTLTQQVIDNNVLLRWNDVTQTLPILNYELRKGASWAAATVIGTKQGGFTTVFETAAGSYTYWLAGIDSAGNYGTPGSVTALVNQPPDYVLKLSQNSTWSGTKTNIITAETGQLVNVNTTETWTTHFTSRSWTSPQDQINAGYSYFLMPSTTTASYEEEVDYGTLLAGTKVTSTLTSSVVAGTTTITPTIRTRGTTSTAATYSQATTTITVTSTAHGLAVGDYVYLSFTTGTATTDTYVVATSAANTFTVTSATSATTSGNVNWIKWTSYAGLSEVFATSFRYFRVRYDFASVGGDDLQLLTALNVRLDSKLRNDSGTGTANSADTGGTTVNFNLAFVDVDSISVTPTTTSAVIAVYDFVDAPNPTSFKVLLFNTSGTRVSGGFSWSARGV